MKSKRIIALMATLLIGGSTVGAFAGCGGSAVANNDYDKTKANLSVATYDGGVGSAWLTEAAARFEKLHENSTHFQAGRTGVKINVDPDKVKYQGPNIEDKALNKDMYFAEGFDYYNVVNQGKAADITDVMTGSMSAYNEIGTIADKLDANVKAYLTAKDGKYYMVPFYDGFYGFVYDIDLFESEGFYFDQDGDFLRLVTEGQRADFEANKSNGPDGVKGTYDDGLPATYEQLVELADYIVSKSCIPFCYAGGGAVKGEYVTKACRSLIADYEGYESFKLNYTLDGTATLVKEIAADGTIETEEVEINQSNAYELQRQAGKYYALKLQEELFGSVKYIGGSWNAFNFTDAQTNFIMSKYAGAGKRYAMLLEGVWWENEADNVFTDMEILKGEKKSDRRFGWLPMPKVNEEAAGQQTMFSGGVSFGFINSNCENMELAKEFMRFLHTDAEMSKFSAKTSISRSFNYTVKEEDKVKATSFGKAVIEMRDQAKVVYPHSALDLIINNASTFDVSQWYTNATVNGKDTKDIFAAFKDGTATAESYFNGLYTYQKKNWSNLQK